VSNPIPEPSTEPQEEKYEVASGCGHEVYSGELLVEWYGKQLCEDCFRDRITDMSTEELAGHLRCEFRRT
jgi:hypothetical protein